MTKATLTVTANNESRVYGAANPAFDGVIVGIQNGDAIMASFASPATATSSVGSYAIVPTTAGAALANYNVSLVVGSNLADAPSKERNHFSITYRPASPSPNYGSVHDVPSDYSRAELDFLKSVLGVEPGVDILISVSRNEESEQLALKLVNQVQQVWGGYFDDCERRRQLLGWTETSSTE